MKTVRPARPPVSTLTMQQVLDERSELIQEVEDIQAKLGDRNRTLNGERMGSDAYWEWRKRAINAMRVRQKRMAELKQHLIQLRMNERVEAAKLNDNSDSGLLKAAYDLLMTLISDIGGDIDENEQAVVDLLRDRVQRGGVMEVRHVSD